MLRLSAIFLSIVVVLCSSNSRTTSAVVAAGGVSEFLQNTFEKSTGGGGGESNENNNNDDVSSLHERTAGLYRYFGSKLHPNKVNLVKDCDYNDPSKISQFCPPALNPKQNLEDFPSSNNNNNNFNYGNNIKVIPTKCFEAEEEEEDGNKKENNVHDDPDCHNFRYVTNNNENGGKVSSRLLPTTAPVAVTEAVFHQSRLSNAAEDNENDTV